MGQRPPCRRPPHRCGPKRGDARLAENTAEADLNSGRPGLVPITHDQAGDLKRMEGVTPEVISAMEIISHQSTLNRATYQPKLKAEAPAGHIFLTARKLGVQAMNYHMRRRGVGPWTLLAANRTKSPVRDDAPLAVPGTAEWREYQCTGVIDDQEVGQPSAIIKMLYGG